MTGDVTADIARVESLVTAAIGELGPIGVPTDLARTLVVEALGLIADDPATLDLKIATAALAMIPGVEFRNCRKAEIDAEAAYRILTPDCRACTGNFFLDDEVLAAEGVTDLSRYAVEPGAPLLPDLFLG